MRAALIAIAGVLVAGCATAPPPEPKQPYPGHEPGAAPRDVRTLDPVAYAKAYPRPELCEDAARRLQKASRDKAWEVLRACVAAGDFTTLSRLVDGGWSEELRTRPDASLVLAKVIASRGGDVDGDVARLREHKIPLFALGPALSSPELYRGRLVLLRAEVKDVKLAGAKATARLAEFAVGITERYVASSERLVRRDSQSYSSSDGPNAYGESSRTVQRQRRFVSNVPVPTGLEAIARLGQVDPFFGPGRQYVVLARFDGVRDQEGEEPDEPVRVALVSIVAYYEPSPAMVE